MDSDTDTTRGSFRSIRVFVSSTFRDMQDEREELIKRTFPQIRRLCETRGVAWSEVDLRWGVTDEQKAEGAVLPICLAEIDRSRPFFIGLLGQRYGWIPEQLPEGLAEQLPWLSGLSGTSVTEMEILHGVLNDPGAAGHAFFYTRDPAWVGTRPAEERGILAEVGSDDEVAAVGAQAAARAAAARRERLDDLKRRVRDAGLPTWQYPDPRSLGERVLADLTALIDRLFPEQDVPDALAREAEAHRAYGAAQTVGSGVRPELTAQLDAFAGGTQPPLLLTGEAGAGTSAIASSWLAAWRTDHPDDVVIEHHVGATADSSDWSTMAARIIAALGRQLGFECELAAIPSDPGGRRAALFAAIAQAGSASRRAVILVDGADLLTDIDGAPDLTWLPKTVPPNVRIVVTTSNRRPAIEAERRGWPVLAVLPLDEEQRRELIRTFLGRYAKALDEVHVARLVRTPATGNVLFLRTVLDELRQHGDHFTLGDVIEHYLAAPTLDALLGLVLARYERDFERDRPGLVGDSMRALWAARRGLTEPELLDSIGRPGAPVPHAVWSPLVLAAQAGLVTQSGLLVFATEPHRRAVEQRYLAGDDDRRDAHAALARTFATYELNPRVVEELPWQQLGAGDIDGLVATISDLKFMDMAYRQSHVDLRRLWARAEQAGRRVVDGYRAVVDDPSIDPEAAWEVARLVTDAGYPTEAGRLNRFLVQTYRGGTANVTDKAGGTVAGPVAARRLPAALVNLGTALFLQGDLQAAEPPLQEAINLSRSRNDLSVLQAALGDLALVRRDRGDLDGALALMAEEEAMCRRRNDVMGLQASIGNRAQILRQRGDYPGALALMTEQEELCRSIGDAIGVARAKVAQAVVLGDQGKSSEALELYQVYGTVAQEAGDLHGVAEAAINEISTLRLLGHRDEFLRRAAETEALVRRLDDLPLLARTLDAQARLAVDEARWADASRLATEAVFTARTAGAKTTLGLALAMLGTARRELGDLAGARAAHAEEEAVAAAMGDQGALATSRVNMASVDVVAGDLDAALARYAQAEPVLRSLEVHMVLVPLLTNRWQVHAHLGNVPAAIADLVSGAASAAVMGLHQQQREMLTKAAELLYGSGRAAESEPVWADLADVCRTLGDQAGLQRAIGERALMVLGAGDVVTAARLLDEQEQICRRTGDQVGLAACIGNRAILLRQTGDLAGALACIDEQINIAKAGNNGQGYLFATANRGEVLGALGHVGEGLVALNEARTMATNWGLTPMVAQLDQMIAAMHAGQQ